MATLTETSYFARKTINILIILIIIVVILRLSYLAIAPYLAPKTPDEQPTLAFNKIPHPQAQSNISVSGKINYTLETVIRTPNSLPIIPRLMKVYALVTPEKYFDSTENMDKRAARMGFTLKQDEIAQNIWRFSDPTNPLRSLEINEITGEFFLTYDYVSDQNIFQEGTITQSSKNDAMPFLSSAIGQIPDELRLGPQTVRYYRLINNQLTESDVINNADAASITFNRKDIEIAGIPPAAPTRYPVVAPSTAKGANYVVISPSKDGKKKALEARYSFQPIRENVEGTYPTIDSQSAFALLQKNDAFFAHLPKNFSNSVIIRDVYIAYLEPYPIQTFLQPVLVFTDKKDFVAYVPLISRDWLIKAQEAPAK